ncbi:unnamed protein product [Oikopleura dioica]|uniref:Uncharacterized protein n=1 Tax=Oikopleura dioica TaxID=34765 RepID=E4XHZ9_OIKDI|nr:unnamed protein product [Oikopleura dioica]
MSRLLSARLDLSKCAKLSWNAKSQLLHVSVRFQSADSSAVGPQQEKLRKSYKMMRPVRPSDDILAPRQYLHMMQQTDIQHTRWKLQGGWKKKVAWLSIILGLVCYIYWYTLEIFKRDSFYAELEAAENESRELEGRMPLGYNISDPKDDEEFE